MGMDRGSSGSGDDHVITKHVSTSASRFQAERLRLVFFGPAFPYLIPPTHSAFGELIIQICWHERGGRFNKPFRVTVVNALEVASADFETSF